MMNVSPVSYYCGNKKKESLDLEFAPVISQRSLNCFQVRRVQSGSYFLGQVNL